MSEGDRRALAGVIEAYFNGLYRADAEALRDVFHDDLGYVNATPGAFVAKNLDEYLEVVASRNPSPLPKGAPPPQLLKVDQISDTLAIVQATMTLMGRDYRDALTLIKTGGKWKIVAKIFTFTEQEASKCHTST